MIPTPTFFVPSKPQGQGNHRIGNGGRFGRLYDSNRNLKPWRKLVAHTAIANGWTGREVLDCGVALSIVFFFRRPKSHFTKKGLTRSAPAFPECTGDDWDKLARAIGDALTGLVYRDDRRVVCGKILKMWGSHEGALVSVATFQDPLPMDASINPLQWDSILRDVWPDRPWEQAWAMAPKYDTTTQKAVKGAA